jgi:hypothetical protein
MAEPPTDLRAPVIDGPVPEPAAGEPGLAADRPEPEATGGRPPANAAADAGVTR